LALQLLSLFGLADTRALKVNTISQKGYGIFSFY